MRRDSTGLLAIPRALRPGGTRRRWRPLTAVTGGAWLLLAVVACAGPPGQDGQRGEDADLQASLDGFFQAMADRSHEEVAAWFAEDGVVHVAGMPEIRGRGAIEGFYGNLFRFLESSAGVPDEWRVSDDGTMAFVTGSTLNAFRGAEGLVEYQGKFVMVWIREAGEWRLGAYSVSSDQGNGGAG